MSAATLDPEFTATMAELEGFFRGRQSAIREVESGSRPYSRLHGLPPKTILAKAIEACNAGILTPMQVRVIEAWANRTGKDSAQTPDLMKSVAAGTMAPCDALRIGTLLENLGSYGDPNTWFVAGA